MFRNNTKTIAEPTSNVEEHPADDLHVGCDLVALSVLALDLDEPSVGGWAAYLTCRGIPVVLDDIGRAAISRADARQLFDEHREDEIRRREVAVRQEQRAIEQDRRFRANLPSGLPWYAIPDGVSYGALVAQPERDARPRRRSVLEDSLAGSGTTFHPIRDDIPSIRHDGDES